LIVFVFVERNKERKIYSIFLSTFGKGGAKSEEVGSKVGSEFGSTFSKGGFLKVDDLQNHINLNSFYSQPIVERWAIYFNRATSNTPNFLDYMIHFQCVFAVCAKDYVMSQIFVSVLRC
jgi:hypothetical protein